MNITNDDIKEISLVTNYVFYNYDKDAYTDLLRISKGCISYKRTNFHTKKEVVSWSYKSKSPCYIEKFNRLVFDVCNLFNSEEHIIVGRTDSGSFNLRVTINDGTHLDFHGDSNLYENELNDIADAIRRIIPKGEIYPDFIDKYSFYRENLTKEIIATIDKNKLIAIMYAESGAMGNAGEIEIMDEDGVVYSNEESYTGIKIKDNQRISQFDVTALFDGFEPVGGFDYDIHRVYLNEMTWVYINLGAGNHLYLRCDVYKEYGFALIDTDYGSRYQSWCNLTKRLWHNE